MTRKFINTLTIRDKIRYTYIPLLIALTIAIAFLMFDLLRGMSASKTINDVVELSNALDGVAHNLAVERGLTAGFLGSGGAKGKDKVDKQRKVADDAKQHFLSIKKQYNSAFNDKIADSLQSLANELQKLDRVRKQINALDSSADAFNYYSGVNKLALDAISLLIYEVNDPKIIKQMRSMLSLLWLKERSGQERGLLNGIFSKGSFNTQKSLLVNGFIKDQEGQLDQLAMLNPADFMNTLNAALNNESGIAVKQYRHTFTEANETGQVNVDAAGWFAAATNRIKTIKSFGDQISADIIASARTNFLLSLFNTLFFGTAFVVGLLFMRMFTREVSSNMENNINSIVSALYRVRETKDFSSRIDQHSNDELGEAFTAFNSLMEQLQLVIKTVNKTLAEISVGKFSSRISEHFSGDLNTLKHGVNDSAEKVEITMNALEAIMDSLQKGDFSKRMSSEVEGDFKHKVDNALKTIDNALQSVNSTMTSISQGDFSHRIDIPLNGSLNTLKNGVNSSIANVEHALQSITQALIAQKNGQFTYRIAGDFSGDLKTIQATINDSMSSVDMALQDINRVFEKFVQGDFSERITSPMDGDLRQMKDNVNQSINTLSNAIEEIVDVAQSQQQGRLQQSINGNYAGKLLELKTALNSAGQSLQTTIKDVANVMKATQSGNFSLRIEGAMPGDYGDLKDTFNDSMDNLQRQVNQLSNAMEAQENGDLTQRMDTHFSGDLSRICNAFNNCSSKLVSTLEQIKKSGQETLSMAKEQTAATTDMASRTEDQASSLEQITSSMDKIDEIVKETSQQSNDMRLKIIDAQASVENCQTTIEHTVQGMEKMRVSTREIESFTDTIDELAFQTNLLALNAAVEAARAGEQGRGFAVVASEVRNLAQRSADAAKNIKELIDQSILTVESGVSWVEKSRDEVELIGKSISDVIKTTVTLEHATTTQAKSIAEVSISVQTLDDKTQQNAAMVEQATAATKSVEEQVHIVNDSLAFFKLG